MKQGLYGKYNKIKKSPIFKNNDIEVRCFVYQELIYWEIKDINKISECEIYEISVNPTSVIPEKPWRVIALPYIGKDKAYFEDYQTIKDCLDCIVNSFNAKLPHNLVDIIEADLISKKMIGQYEG